MQLKKILNNIEYEIINGTIDIDIKDISYDSREIKQNYAFVCLIGIDTDGHNYIKEAIKNGATCKNVDINTTTTIIKIKDTRQQLSIMSANLFGNPQEKLIKIGITGTKGKTSTSWILKKIIEETKEKVGIIGTLGTYIDNYQIKHKNTTPESYQIQKFMKQMVDNNIKYLIMEASSTALKVGRINNITFDYAIFTNLSTDHIGPREHPTYEDYKNSKIKLFKQSKIGIINKDDQAFEEIKNQATCKIYTYGKNKTSDIIIKDIKYQQNQNKLTTTFTLETKGNRTTYEIPAPGEFSAQNSASAILVARLLGINETQIKKGLQKFKVEGRCEIINIGNKNIIIDFAHNQLSMESLIKTIKKYHPKKIITIFGCGGGRSKQIRYELGKTAGKLSDLSIITTDNPRNDNIEDIIRDIEKGIKEEQGQYEIIKDRKEAIIHALDIVKEHEIILLLGKGHEKYQEIQGKKYPFDEKEIINNYIKGR